MRVRKTAASLLVIGMTVQILLGIVWILCNFPSQWTYPETEYYISVADSWILDEYTGVLYPVLIKGSQMVMGFLGLPFEGLLYLVQIIVAFMCYSVFVLLCWWNRDTAHGHGEGEEQGILRGGNRKSLFRAAFGGLYLMTVPLCVQWHLSILPNSLLSSLFLLLLGFCIRAVRNKEYCNRKFVLQVCILWAAMTLLQPDYWWFGLIPVLYIGISLIRQKAFRMLLCLLAVAIISSVGSVAINTLVQTPGSNGKIQKSLGASMVSRMVWPNFHTNYFFWPDEIKEIMTQIEGLYISEHADMVQISFGPMVEEAYGKEKANEFYWEMAINCFTVRTKEVVTAIRDDFAAYLFTPWQVKVQLDGGGLSYSGWNYGKMKTETPGLTRWYVDYGLISFRIGIILVACLEVGECIKRRRIKVSGCREGRCLLVLCVLSQVMWYTMAGGGMMDYRNVPVVVLLWYYVIVLGYKRLDERIRLILGNGGKT